MLAHDLLCVLFQYLDPFADDCCAAAVCTQWCAAWRRLGVVRLRCPDRCGGGLRVLIDRIVAARHVALRFAWKYPYDNGDALSVGLRFDLAHKVTTAYLVAALEALSCADVHRFALRSDGAVDASLAAVLLTRWLEQPDCRVRGLDVDVTSVRAYPAAMNAFVRACCASPGLTDVAVHTTCTELPAGLFTHAWWGGRWVVFAFTVAHGGMFTAIDAELSDGGPERSSTLRHLHLVVLRMNGRWSAMMRVLNHLPALRILRLTFRGSDLSDCFPLALPPTIGANVGLRWVTLIGEAVGLTTTGLMRILDALVALAGGPAATSLRRVDLDLAANHLDASVWKCLAAGWSEGRWGPIVTWELCFAHNPCGPPPAEQLPPGVTVHRATQCGVAHFLSFEATEFDEDTHTLVWSH